MRSIILTLMMLTTMGCSIMGDIRTPDVPYKVYEEMKGANRYAFDVLRDLDVWIEEPSLVPDSAAGMTRAKIENIKARLNVVRLWMLNDNVEGGVTQTVVDLLAAWEDHIDNHFCEGEDAWLTTRVMMNVDDTYAWHKVFRKLEKLHKQVRTWMDHKGIKENE